MMKPEIYIGSNRPDIETVFRAVAEELAKAEAKHPPMNSAHEGHSVIREELDELWDHVRADTGYGDDAYAEAKQIAAMGIRYMLMVAMRRRLGLDLPTSGSTS